MSKIENPVVLVNVHKNHENSVAVHVTNGSNDYRDVRKGCIADLDEAHPDDAMERLPLEVLYYTAMALEGERSKYKNIRQIFEKIVHSVFKEDTDMLNSGAYEVPHVQFAWNVLQAVVDSKGDRSEVKDDNA
ncbi:hypothetical protein [Providencia rettgeri]|uniref:hypothetical protein n=1 Tax=Providencia rettgeri TaxID=587 RepID=UPI000CFEEAF4|nr:hypothetical protein CEQ08_13445 [Providencia rettgeri]